MKTCCEYHANPILNEKKITIPAYICFHSPNGKKLIGVVKDIQKGKIDFGDRRPGVQWSHSCQKAFQICDFPKPRNTNHLMYWSFNINGKDVYLCNIKDKSYCSSHEVIPNVENMICMGCQNTCMKSDELKEDMKFPKIHLKFNMDQSSEIIGNITDMNTSDIQFSKNSITHSIKEVRPCKKKKGRSEEHQKLRKSQKDESLLIDDSEEEDDFTWTPDDDIWETAEFEKYVMLHPSKAPTLSRINLEFKTNTCDSKYCNPLYECVFIHPISKKEMIVDVASTILFNIPDYKPILKSYREGNT